MRKPHIGSKQSTVIIRAVPVRDKWRMKNEQRPVPVVFYKTCYIISAYESEVLKQYSRYRTGECSATRCVFTINRYSYSLQNSRGFCVQFSLTASKESGSISKTSSFVYETGSRLRLVIVTFVFVGTAFRRSSNKREGLLIRTIQLPNLFRK